MFSSFNGDYRRKPVINNRGASKKESKEELLRRAQEERQKRERLRIQTSAAIRLQSGLRSYQVRKRKKEDIRKSYDALGGSQDSGSVQMLEEKLRKLLFIFDVNQDYQRLVWCTQQCIRFQKPILNELTLPKSSPSSSSWAYLIPKLLQTCLRLFDLLARKSENINPLLRLFEVFTDPEHYKSGDGGGAWQSTSWSIYLVRGGYFKSLRILCDSRIPKSIDAYQGRAPTPMAETLFQLIMRPLSLLGSEEERNRKEVLLEFTRAFLSTSFSPQVRFYILPALRESAHFPFISWTLALRDHAVPLESQCWLLFSFLSIGTAHACKLEKMEEIPLINYLSVLSHLGGCLSKLKTLKRFNIEEDEPSEDEDEAMEEDPSSGLNSVSAEEAKSIEDCIDLLNNSDFVSGIVTCVESCELPLATRLLCKICHQLLLSDKNALYSHKLFNTLAFKPALIYRLWNIILDTKQPSTIGNPVPLLTVISRGIRMTAIERDAIVPLLAVFSSVFGYLLVTINDTEFYDDSSATNASPAVVSVPSSNKTNLSKHWMPFTLNELVPMSLALRDVTLGLIELAFPESRPSIREEYQQAVRSVRGPGENDILDSERNDTQIWSHLFKKIVELLRQLYTRDTRRQFCPDGHWICDSVKLPLDRTHDIGISSRRRSRLRQYRPFQGLRLMSRAELEEEGPPLSTKEVRLATVLRDMPYAISFSQRVLVFHDQVTKNKNEHQGDRVNFMQGPSININVRRNFLYEDAFEKLSVDNEPNLCLKMRIQMMNTAGLEEAGIDGGGLFREFITELLKTAFDPNRGFFRLTKDHQLYPNPSVDQIEDNFIPHYYFIGRMMGKALYENHLVELPLASFFLSKMLGQRSVNVDIDHLSSLDPELYKNLLYLKTYDGEVQDLGLDFTVASEEIGKTTVEELKPDGANITVDNENRIEYIHLVADYKLNKQIKQQCNAFRNGLNDVINLDWLRMFSHSELQTLISGAEHEIDVEDLMLNTKYGNGYTPDHPTVIMFWNVVRRMTESQKRSLLKFVTSCSRPPLLGFKELYPPFYVQNAGLEETRLPTASTCMNLLKLPEFKNQAQLKEKLLYAVESGAGFELS